MESSSGACVDEAPAAPAAPAAPPRRFLLRQRGAELQETCKRCAEEWDESREDFEQKFLSLDTWIRVFDGEPLQTLKEEPKQSTEAKAETEEVADGDGDEAVPPVTDETKDEPKEEVKEQPKVLPRFAKYKRLKEALLLFATRFGDDALHSLVPKILHAASAEPSVQELPSPPKAKVTSFAKLRTVTTAQPHNDVEKTQGDQVGDDMQKSDKDVSLSATAAYSLLANMFLLNVKDFVDLQKLYLSSAKAAPQKILCLLTFFHFSEASESVGRTLHFRRAALGSAGSAVKGWLPEPVVPEKKEEAKPDASSATDVSADAKPDATGSATAESSGEAKPDASSATAESSGEAKPDASSATDVAADAKPDATGEPEVQNEDFEMDSSAEGERMECPGFFPSFAKAAGESDSAMLVLLSSANSALGALGDVKTPPEEVPCWEMPELICVKLLLGSLPLAEEEVLLARNLRHVNRCSTEGPLLMLSEDRPPESLYDVVAMDISRHVDDRRFAIQFLRRDAAKWAASFRLFQDMQHSSVAVAHAPLLGVDKHWCYAMQVLAAGHHGLKLRYALSQEGYGSAGSEATTELSPAQVKEAKHFEALTGRMASTAWRPCDLLRLLALFPFLRNDSEKFHAFWTRRLRDKSLPDAGRPTRAELADVRKRQSELWPPEPPVQVEIVPPAPEKPAEPVTSWRQEWKANDKKRWANNESGWKQKQSWNHSNGGYRNDWNWNRNDQYRREDRRRWEDRDARRDSRSPEKKRSRNEQRKEPKEPKEAKERKEPKETKEVKKVKEVKEVKKVDRRRSRSRRRRSHSRSRSRQRRRKSRERRK